MEPVPVTRTVRRTVRMAVALVIGQALLCALIGWLTFSSSRSGQGGAGAVVDQFAAPPPAAPIPSPTSSIVRPSPSTASLSPRTTTSPRTAGPARTTKAPPTGLAPPPISTTVPLKPAPTGSPDLDVPTAPAPPISLTPPPTGLTPPPTGLTPPPTGLTPPPTGLTPPPAGGVQLPVTVGDQCRPEGAFGRTEKGTLVRCLPGWRHQLRWKIV